jgi:hypothetical protein
MKIFQFSIYCASNADEPYQEHLREFDYSENTSSYIISASEFYNKSLSVKKKDLLKVEMWSADIIHICTLSTWCFNDQLEQAKELVREKMHQRLKFNKDNADRILEHFVENNIEYK